MPDKNTTSVNPLMDRFAVALAAVEFLEKQVNGACKKFTKAAHTPELAKCLSPESNDCDKHLQRIALMQASLSLEPDTKEKHPLNIPKLKKASLEQDLDIIGYALGLQNQKLAHYELIHALACAMDLLMESELIEQTIIDNRNTNTWLRQIIQNVIAPYLQAEP